MHGISVYLHMPVFSIQPVLSLFQIPPCGKEAVLRPFDFCTAPFDQSIQPVIYFSITFLCCFPLPSVPADTPKTLLYGNRSAGHPPDHPSFPLPQRGKADMHGFPQGMPPF